MKTIHEVFDQVKQPELEILLTRLQNICDT